MLLRNRCGEPDTSQIALRNPNATPDKYRAEISDAQQHWQGEFRRALKISSSALKVMSRTIVHDLTAVRDWDTARSTRDAEYARRRVIGALGIATLLRSEWEDQPVAVPNAIGLNGELGTLLDLVYDQEPDPTKLSESRVHINIAVAGAMPEGSSGQWYREDGLWMHQKRPAEPSDYLAHMFLPSVGIEEPDFSGHETVYPYIAAK